MRTVVKTASEIIAEGEHGSGCPLPLEVIPNYMGINLCSVDSITWEKQDDGQLVSLTIRFLPDPQEKR